MRARAPLSFGQCEAQVEDMMQRGMAFSHVEDAIDIAPLSELHKAALWLLAWSLRDRCCTRSLRDRVQQRRDARCMLAAAAGGWGGR
jgi:hypothetical protein